MQYLNIFFKKILRFIKISKLFKIFIKFLIYFVSEILLHAMGRFIIRYLCSEFTAIPIEYGLADCLLNSEIIWPQLSDEESEKRDKIVNRLNQLNIIYIYSSYKILDQVILKEQALKEENERKKQEALFIENKNSGDKNKGGGLLIGGKMENQDDQKEKLIK